TSETPGKLVFITKTDFATESRAGEVHPYFVETIQQLKALDSLGSQNYAPLADVNGFLWLFWECCVVNGGGYFLYYKTSGNEGIPEAVFQGSDTIEFDMLLLFSALGGSPRSAGGGSIPLTSAANVLVTEAWKSGSALFAQLRDENDLPLLQYQPTYPAGTLGFNLNWKHDALQDAAADIPVGSLYQLFQYSLRDNGDYRHSIWSLPMGPTKAGGGGAASPAAAEEPWEYNEVFPLSRFVKEGSPGTLPNRYQVIHRTAEVGFRMIDVYGNALPGGGRYTFTPQYNDPLIAVSEWPGLNLSYEVLPGNARQADLNVLLRFEPASISPAPGGSPLQSPSGFDPETDKSLVLAALKRYQLIYDQVSDPNVSCHIQSSLMSSATEARVMMVILPQLAAFVAGILLDLQDMLDGGLPPNRTTVLSASIPFSDVVGMAENIAALTVNLRLLREVGQSPDALVDKLPAIATVVSEVPANYQDSTANSAGATGGSPAGGPTSLAVFAANFEKAFSGYDGGVGKLKLMQGQSDKDGFADAHRSALWVWRLSPDNGTGFTFSPDFVFLGIRPLSNRLMTRVVSDITYTGVDLDAWARDFLQLMDTAFDPSVAAGMILYDQLKGTSFYNQLTGYRESLAGRIPAGIVTLFEEQAGQGDPDLAAKQLTQVLLQKLSAAYTISTIVQVPAEVHDSATASPVTTDYTPRLQGSVEVPQSGPLSPQSPGKSGEAQQFTFSSSKLALAAGRQWLNFLLSVKDPSAQTFLELPLQYRVNYMQAGFEPEKAHQAFIPSSWLKFAIAGDPLLQPMLTDDPVRIPVPLRVDPQPPTLVQQSGLGLPLPPRTSPHDIEADIREALRWEYRSRIAHSWSHQDELFLTVTYNQPIGDLSDNAGDPREQLFDALAALRQSPTTNPDWLKPLTAMAVSEDHATVDIGDLDGNLKDFLALVQNIAGAWPDYDPSGIRSNLLGPAGLTRHDFRVSYDLNDPRSILVGGRWQQGIELIWPEISDAKSQHAQPGPIVPGQSPDPQGSPEWAWEKRLYTFAEIPDLSELDFLWQPLNILDVQTADTSAYVVRNDNLVPGKTTNPLFVYQTAEVNYTNPTIPLIEHDHLDPLAAGTTLTASLEAILNPLMQVGTVVDALLRLEIGYGFNVAPPASQPLMANSRMLLADGIRIGSAASAGFPQKLASELAAWYRHMRPSTRNGELTIQLFLFANVEGQELPLVILRDIPLQTGTSDGWWQ
ncbi:MAG: hypothetical protein KDI06_13585, partial [Calditrichaeota bacterium]|nr:hypothetical protein [Calditrichota bacterium]